MKTLIAYHFPSRRSPNAALPRQRHYPFTRAELSDDEDRPERGGLSKNNVLSENRLWCTTRLVDALLEIITIFRHSHPPKSVNQRSYGKILLRKEEMRLIVAGKEGNRGHLE